VYPDDLDKAWAEGMAKEDLQVNPVPDGFHITGFVNTTTGAKLKTVLQSLSAPTGADDPRTGAQRRVDGLEKLLDSVLTCGLPQDKGVRPHVAITVDADTLRNHEGTGDLIGYGAIGVDQIQQIVCEAEVTPIIIDKNDRNNVLDVGRSKRLGMKTQRQAVLARQNSICAAPGCHAPVVHIHHVIWWSHGGTTDLANLIGLCPRCHHAVHRGVMTIDPDTHEIRDRRGLLLSGAGRRRRRPRRLPPEHARQVLATVN